MRFLRLDLSLHAGAGIFFGILNYATKQGCSISGAGGEITRLVVNRVRLGHMPPWAATR